MAEEPINQRLTLFGHAFDRILSYGSTEHAQLELMLQERGNFDVLLLPGTTAAAFRRAAGSFTSTLQKPYVIDPRSYLLQLRASEGSQDPPKYAGLAAAHGDRVAGLMRERALTVDDLRDRPLLEELVGRMLTFEGSFETAADREMIDEYSKLIGEPITRVTGDPLPLVLVPPYFACSTALEDDSSAKHMWFWANVEMAEIAVSQAHDHPVCPVISLSRHMLVNERDRVIRAYNNPSYAGFFFVVDYLDEYRAPTKVLRGLRDFVRELTVAYGKPVMNLAGGYYSLLLYHEGLSGVCHAIGYGENRHLTGSSLLRPPRKGGGGGRPPARYYMEQLHRFYARADAEYLLLTMGTDFWCRCEHCFGALETGALELGQISDHGLHRHFLRARQEELAHVIASEPAGLCSELREQFARVGERADPTDPIKFLLTQTGHLERWAEALS